MAILVQLLTGKCSFKRRCDLYDPDSVTCNKEAGPYCGKYREFELASLKSSGSSRKN